MLELVYTMENNDISGKKDKMLTVKIDEQTLKDFGIASRLRGATMSGLVHQFIVSTIHQQREKFPDSFRNVPQISRDEVAKD